MTDKIKLEPIEEKKDEEIEETEKKIMLPEKEGIFIMNQMIDLCAIFQSALNLPETSNVEKDPNFYIEEIIKILIDHGLLTN